MLDFLIVGCGLAGTTVANILSEHGKKVVIIDKRNHIAGNAYDYYDEAGILVQKYGAHIFHTSSDAVWNYLSRFTKWTDYQHRVLTYVNGMLLPFPINVNTINMLYGTNYNEEETKAFLGSLHSDIEINNSRDVVVSQVGEELYKLFFEGYTKKQWGLYPEQMEKEVTKRIPIRANRDNRYFTNKYQGMPKYGYTKMVENMLSGVRIMLNTDYADIKGELEAKFVIFTGKIDEFYNYKHGSLPYRSLRFENETIDKEYFQAGAVVNYPNDNDFTRIIECKHMTGQLHPKTTIIREYPQADGEPFYPVPMKQSKELYYIYKQAADAEKSVLFLGRLGTYSYLDMDAVVLQSIAFADKLLK